MDKNKHKPLSPEELLKLLDDTSGADASLDDFESEALEGYSRIGSEQKIKSLQADIDASISKRVAEGSSKKNNWVRYALAASLLLMVTLSIIVYKTSFVENDSMVAIKESPSKTEQKEEQLQQAPIVANNELEVATAITTRSENTTKTSVSDESNLELKAAEKFGAPGAGAKLEAKPVSTEVAPNAIMDGDIVSAKKEAQKPDDASKTIPQEEEREVATSSKDKKEATPERKKQDKANDDQVAAQGSLAEVDSKAPASAPADLAKNKSQVSRGATSDTDANSKMKEYILDYYRKNELQVSELKGSFKIKALPLKDGSLKVLSVVNKKVSSKAMTHVEEALKAIKNWQQASDNEKKSSSEMEFEVQF